MSQPTPDYAALEAARSARSRQRRSVELAARVEMAIPRFAAEGESLPKGTEVILHGPNAVGQALAPFRGKVLGYDFRTSERFICVSNGRRREDRELALTRVEIAG